VVSRLKAGEPLQSIASDYGITLEQVTDAIRCALPALPEPWVFFLDRSMGSRLVADALRVRGEIVEAHDAHFAKDAADVEWLGAVGRKRWVVVSKDDRIR